MNTLTIIDGLTGEVVDGDAVAFGELYARSNSSFVDAVQLRLQCGQGLAEKKATMAHGEWGPWLAANEDILGFGERTARMLMVAAKRKLTSDLDVPEALSLSRRMWGHKEILEDAKLIRAELEADRKEERTRQSKENADQSYDLTGEKTYRVIYADPPWKYNDKRDDGGLDAYSGATHHYPIMTIDELCELPVESIVQDDAVLFLWITSPLLFDAKLLIDAWGFTYKASFVWDKVAHNVGREI